MGWSIKHLKEQLREAVAQGDVDRVRRVCGFLRARGVEINRDAEMAKARKVTAASARRAGSGQNRSQPPKDRQPPAKSTAAAVGKPAETGGQDGGTGE